MRLCPDDICQMLLNKKTTASQKRRANKCDEIERESVTDLEQNEQKVHSQKGSTNKFGEIGKKLNSRVDLEQNE